MLKNYKLFIYENLNNSIRQEYWEQIDNAKWIPISQEMFEDLEEEGWIEDLEYFHNNINRYDISHIKLDLTDKDKNGLINDDDDDIGEDFNEFDIELKDKQEYPYPMLDMIDYEKGIVYILKYNDK